MISLSLMGQQENQVLKDLKDFKDLKEQRYAKKRRSGHTALESKRPGNSENPSRHYFRQLRDMQGTVLKVGNASQQQMDSILWELFDAAQSEWSLNDRELFTYDEQGNMGTYVWYAYDSDAMEILPFYKETVKHNADGQPTEIISFMWVAETGQWLNNRKFELSYDDKGNLIEQIVSDWDPDANQWLNIEKFELSYDDKGNLIKEIISDWDPDANQWQVGVQFEMTYDSQGEILFELWSFWDEESSALVEAFKDEYIYIDGQLTVMNEYIWEEGEWVLFFRTTFVYDDSGNLIEELTQFWDSSSEQWFDIGKILYAYNESDQLIMEEEWELGEGQFMLTQTWQSDYVWDSDGNLTEQVDKSWEEVIVKGTNTWQNAFKSEWVYNKDFTISDLYVPYWFLDFENQNFMHMPVTETGYVYVEGNWVMDFRQQAYYSDFGASTEINEAQVSHIKVFPIPAAEQITFNWEDSYGSLNLELYDLTGKLVISRSIDNNEIIGVDQLPGGIYLYKLIDNSHPIHTGKISIE